MIKKIIQKNCMMIFVIGILLIMVIGGVYGGYARSSPSYVSSSGVGSSGYTYKRVDRTLCDAGQDFVLQIAPFGCTPAVVRSDLLEEQNVPVFCQIAATKINPLIDVEAIESMSFSGNYPREVAGVGFHPAKSALGSKDNLNSPILENIGYAVIVLNKQRNASAMPDFVEGNLTAKIRYDIENAFGIGKASYYLPEMKDTDFEDKKIQYGFWSGKGYLRAESIDDNEAVISVYDDTRKISSFNLKKGETSNKIYLPGLDCMSSLQVKLNGLDNPDTRVKLKVGGDIVEVKEKEKFLENRCYVSSIDKKGLMERVKIKCKEDEKTNNFVLEISPRVKLEFEGQTDEEKEKGYAVGDILYVDEDSKRNVFLGYMGKRKSDNILFIMPVISTARDKDEFLDSIDVTLVEKLAKIEEDLTTRKATVVDVLKAEYALFGMIMNAITRGTDFGHSIYIDEKSATEFRIGELMRPFLEAKKFWTADENWKTPTYTKKQIDFTGFTGAQNKYHLENIEYVDEGNEKNLMKNLKAAGQDYKIIQESFPNIKEKDDDRLTFGEKGLFEEFQLNKDIKQMKTAVEIANNFKEKYPNSEHIKTIKEFLNNQEKLSSQEIDSKDVLINGRVHTISFKGIYEPSFEEYGAVISITGTQGLNRDYKMTKSRIIPLSNTESLELLRVEEDFIEIEVNAEAYGIKEGFLGIKRDKHKIELGNYKRFGKENQYKITLNKINLKKSAQVTVIPGIDNAGTEANFPFKIGIEQRAIELSPSETKKKIKKLNEDISKWANRSETLGSVVKGLKGACLGVGAFLTIKNFVFNTGGKAIARREVMRADNGWYNICKDAVKDKKISLGEKEIGVEYNSIDECLNENAGLIEKDVNEYYNVLNKQNNEIKSLKAKTEEDFAKVYLGNKEGSLKGESKYRKNLKINLKKKYGDEIVVDNNKINVDEFVNNLNITTVTSDELKSLELKSRMGGDSVDRLKINDDLRSEIKSIYLTNKEYNDRQKVLSEMEDSNLKGVGYRVVESKDSISVVYDGGKYQGDTSLGEIEKGDRIQRIRYQGKDYLVKLSVPSGKTYGVEEVYNIQGIKSGDDAKDIKQKLVFKLYDRTSYQNPFKSTRGDSVPKVKYYETEPYKGLPAMVPFDLNNGWYAATKPTTAGLGNIRAFDDSGRVASFYLCNVGENNREEFKRVGGDICEMINLNTGQPYNEFPGLDKAEASKLTKNAVKAIEQASRAYKKGVKKVSILGTGINVGSPEADIPDMKCQDFMSANDCKLLFNVCDPVICPSSRCDFGGAFPVKDVIQSGIAGSIALCLPNWNEGIIMPVCLSGIKAGIDSLLSVFQSYKDCLQNSLDTGEMTGICDEIYSIELCNFLWKTTLPLAQMAVPKIIESVLGQGQRGGGEYLGVSSAWENAENSVTYFTQYYAANSYKAFKSRTTEDVGGELCKSFNSGVYPSSGNLFDALVEPDSPPQFHGKFDEIPFTSATNPPISQYKVFYHIYAGKDSRAYYKVYLRPKEGGSFYQDTSVTRLVASGFIVKGGYATETKDFTAPSGYNQLCINVNGQEECGFQQVSTSAAINYVKDKYMEEQATQLDIKTEASCISGTRTAYSLLNPNLQEGADELLDPSIYDRGIIRICATDNPGKGTDANVGSNESKWKDVGYCTNQKMRCWLDTESVKDVIHSRNVEGETLKEINENFMDKLRKDGKYLEQKDYDEIVKLKLNVKSSKEDALNIIEKISDEIIEMAFLNYQKATLYLMRAGAFGKLAKEIDDEIKAKIVEGKGM